MPRRSAVAKRSKARPPATSEAAAHFELAQHLWRQEGFSPRAITHFNAAHKLQPDNITYKRQAYSAWRRGDSVDPQAFFRQVPEPGDEATWPFVSDFGKDMAALGVTY